MNRLRVLPIVEGHGEVGAIRGLLSRIGHELLGGISIETLRPIRIPRTRLVQGKELQRAVNLAALKSKPGARKLILVLLDADEDPPCELGPKVLTMAQESRPDVDVDCVVANVEYETWFVAGAESLGRYLDLEPGDVPRDPEQQRCGKSWIKKRFRDSKYSETIHQPSLSAIVDLELCRQRSPSFDKLCRVLEMRL